MTPYLRVYILCDKNAQIVKSTSAQTLARDLLSAKLSLHYEALAITGRRKHSRCRRFYITRWKRTQVHEMCRWPGILPRCCCCLVSRWGRRHGGYWRSCSWLRRHGCLSYDWATSHGRHGSTGVCVCVCMCMGGNLVFRCQILHGRHFL
jgi:hypothetical protein